MLLGITVHDRPKLLRRTLESLSLAGTDYTLVLYGDQADAECRQIAARTDGVIWMDCLHHYGIAHGLNQILRLRRAGEDFCWLASDTALETDGWLRLLEEAPGDIVAPAYACGLWYFRSYVVDVLGGFRAPGGAYGGVDLDYLTRARGAGYEFKEVPGIAYQTPAETNKRGPRREAIERAIRTVSRAEQDYLQGIGLFEPL